MAYKEKSKSGQGLSYECNPNSIKMNGKGLSSSNDTVNPYSFSKSGKAIVSGKK